MQPSPTTPKYISLEAKRKLYKRSEDVPFLRAVGEFPFATAAMYEAILGRSDRRLNRRGKKLRDNKHVGKIWPGDEKQNTAGYYYLRPTEYVMRCAPDGLMMWDKGKANLDHDHEITQIHFAIREVITDWEQRRSHVLEKVTAPAIDRRTKRTVMTLRSFYPDGRFSSYGVLYRLENQHAHGSSSGGESDEDDKMTCYNALLKGRKDEKVIFIRRTPKQVQNFIERYKDEYPYKWCWVTDIESILNNPTGKIFRTPHDDGTYAFSDLGS